MKLLIEPITIPTPRETLYRYRVWQGGAVLIEQTKNPEHDSCRALLARGFIGQLEFWWVGATHAASSIDIERGAKWTIREGERQSPVLARHVEFNARDVKRLAERKAALGMVAAPHSQPKNHTSSTRGAAHATHGR